MSFLRLLILTLLSLAGPLQPCLALNAAGQLAEAKALEIAGQNAKAKEIYLSIAKRHPKSAEAAAALFAAARIEEASNDYLAAYRLLERLVDRYPHSRDFNSSLEGMFRIASKFLEGEKLKLLGVPAVPSMGKAAEMFDKIVAVGPFSRIAPAAQFNSGLAYEKAKRYPEAIASYERVSENYPGSEFAPDALYQAAYVQMLQARGSAYDQTMTKKALNGFQEFIITYPNHPKVPQALKNITQLESRKAKGALSVAEFYEAHGNPSAAILSYQRVIDQKPGTDDARRAAERIAALRAKANADARGESQGFKLSSLVPKLPKISIPFKGKKESGQAEDPQPIEPNPAKKLPKRTSPPSADESPASPGEDVAPASFDFADPGPQIRSDLDRAIGPVPGPETSETSLTPDAPETPQGSDLP